MPFYRQEEQFASDRIELDRGTMARSVEEVGACLGAIVLACADDARKHAFCLSTDVTARGRVTLDAPYAARFARASRLPGVLDGSLTN